MDRLSQQTLDGIEPYKILSCQGYGQIQCKFMFVGISAGKLGALKTNVPFTKDSSGRLLQRVLGELGFSKSDEFSLQPKLNDCWITNLVKGKILDESGNNRLPNYKEISYWWQDFVSEVEKVSPNYIIALGDLVFKTINTTTSFHLTHNLKKMKHPRWYASHGAINKNKSAWKEMLSDYKKVLQE